ncbi:hypothetical protein Ccrd_021277 [Cynara cardunculus var. scolymus]|uniref:Leucine-rich repeat-containing protein n=1 Tax=Cynara cardunculus var. scolymus TaxID=59895 RepID=A0A103Y0X0_CYNCS|nr:hypothetical protein Ccrd_021277 [Cynara cardunculus var. scolymus]
MSYGNSERPGKSQKLTGSCSKDNKRLLRSLKILNLSFCKQLHSLCGFIELPALEKLLLSNCIGLIEVCESIWQCDHLELIDLSYCNEVGKILRTIGMLKKVKILKLDGCNLSENLIKMRDTELPEMVMANNLAIHSQTSFSTIVEIIPRDLGSSLIFLSRSLECLSLKNNGLSNESFPMDFSNLSMLKELYLDGNNIVSLPNCVRGLPRLEKLSIDRCNRLTTLEHPPLTLKHLIMGVSLLISKVVFDREMSPIMLSTWTGCRSLIEGMFKVEDMADVEEEVLRSLGWTNLDFIKNQLTESKVEMQYEFGIFSTRYEGKEMPNWISDRREGSSISLTIPSSPHNLKGLNFCIVFMAIKGYLNVLGEIRISNITKNRTWIYNCFGVFESTREGIIVYLSHWMFGKSEMEDGDEVTATVTVMQADEHIGKSLDVLECGISLVYDDGKKKMEEEEEDVLGYYKSWNHIIGGDLSPFQTTTPGVYDLNRWHFFGTNYINNYKNVLCLELSLKASQHSWWGDASNLIKQYDGLDLIDLSYCNNVGKLLRMINKVKNVKILNLDGCNLGETLIEMRDDVEETLNRNNIVMNSQTSSSAIVEAIPRAFESYLIYLPSSLMCLLLAYNNLSNESFPMDMSSLSMLKELYLDGNLFVSLPNWVKSLSRIEILSIRENCGLESLDHPPPTLKELRFDFDRYGEATFNREMSPVLLKHMVVGGYDGNNIEGIAKVEDMRDVEEKVLRSLGWSHLVNLDFTKIQLTDEEGVKRRVKMVYEFGIFSTWYVGKEMPNCISDRRWEGSSVVSFTIPSSPRNLRGLNFFFAFTPVELTTNDGEFLACILYIRISNITKMCSWMYHPPGWFKGSREGITYSSHWMFGKNEMEDGDQITISTFDNDGCSTRECGVGFVYDEDEDEDEDEEDVLGYYKSWNHIIGGDLSPFLTTTPGHYYLQRYRFVDEESTWSDNRYIRILCLELSAQPSEPTT